MKRLETERNREIGEEKMKRLGKERNEEIREGEIW